MVKYVTVSLPSSVAERIKALVEEVGYWLSLSAFVREACLEKILELRPKMRMLEVGAATRPSMRGEGPRRGTRKGISPR